MSFRIIGDSCTDLTKEQKESGDYFFVPLTLQIGEEIFIDDKTFNQKQFIEKMEAYKEAPKSACPAPEVYMELFDGADDIYIVTLSSELSGSYNSALLAKNLYLEEHPNKNIALIDSKSASCGQGLIAMKIKELAESGKKFEEVEKEVNEFRDELETLFVLETLENLRKNGRLSNVKAFIASTLNIKPLMGATKEGTIIQLEQARGMKKALTKLSEEVEKRAKNPEQKILSIAHCNNYERAKEVKEDIERKVKFKDIIIVETAGVSTLYAANGGIIVSF